MATKLGGVISNSGEDFVDELTSLIVYKESNELFKNIKSKLDLKEDSILDEAIDGALSTLQFGIMNVVIITVTEYVLTKSVLVLGGIFAFIKTRRIIKNTIDAGSKIIKKMGPLGFGASKAIDSVSGVLVANQTETLTMAKMANSSANNIVSSIGQERQNQIMISGQKLKRIDNTKSNIHNTRNTARTQNMDLFIHKFETGTWKDTKKDKKLYFDCTGQDEKIYPFNLAFVKQMNEYAPYVRTAKGDIYNQTKATIDLLTKLGVQV